MTGEQHRHRWRPDDEHLNLLRENNADGGDMLTFQMVRDQRDDVRAEIALLSTAYAARATPTLPALAIPRSGTCARRIRPLNGQGHRLDRRPKSGWPRSRDLQGCVAVQTAKTILPELGFSSDSMIES